MAITRSAWATALLCLALPFTAAAQTADSASFITRLGDDTLAVERFVRTAGRVEADVLLRTPTAQRTHYVLELADAGGIARMSGLTRSIGAEGTNLGRLGVERVGDSLQITVANEDGSRTVMTAADAATLPFIDMVHWPFEIVLMRLRAGKTTDAEVPLLSGTRVVPFRAGDVGPDAMTITHPTRGTMRVKVDGIGRLQLLDAGATTRKLIVERGPWIDLDPIAAHWAGDDAAGRSFGALSGRGGADLEVAGATISLDWGTPAKRGRQIWGALVPFGSVWRTGANRATHFTTDRDLVFGSGDATLAVPAGTYTLFSIPEADGGTLIINTQTDITGTAHDPSHDLGRVRMTARPLPATVEVFTITASEEGAGGVLRLQWDATELVVPFTVP